jgi:hypothetical protein
LLVAALRFWQLDPRLKQGGPFESLNREFEFELAVVVGTAEPRFVFSMPLVALFEFK